MANILVTIIQAASWIIVLVVMVDIILSYFMSPYHPIRSTLDRFVNPLLNPIRKLMPQGLGVDFSPVVLILLVQVVEMLLINLIITVR